MPQSAKVPSLETWIEDFLTDKIARRRSEKTVQTYRERLYRFRDWLGTEPLSRAALRRYLVELQGSSLSPATIAAYFRDVHIFCAWLVAERILESNPAHNLTPAIPKRKPASYSVDHVRTLLAVPISRRDRALILTLLDTGMRVSELLGMQRTSINWLTGHVAIIGKGDKERSVWLGPIPRAAIRIYLDSRTDDHPALWMGRWGPLTRLGVHRLIERRAQRVGIRADVRKLVHGFRATFAKLYVQRGGDLKSLADLLGHSTLEMAAHYAQLDESELAEKKAAINPLAAVLS